MLIGVINKVFAAEFTSDRTPPPTPSSCLAASFQSVQWFPVYSTEFLRSKYEQRCTNLLKKKKKPYMSNYVNLGVKFFNIKLNIFLASYCTTHFY